MRVNTDQVRYTVRRTETGWECVVTIAGLQVEHIHRRSEVAAITSAVIAVQEWKRKRGYTA